MTTGTALAVVIPAQINERGPQMVAGKEAPTPLYSKSQVEGVIRQIGCEWLLERMSFGVAEGEHVSDAMRERISYNARNMMVKNLPRVIEALVEEHGIAEVAEAIGTMKEARKELVEEAKSALESAREAVNRAEEACNELSNALSELNDKNLSDVGFDAPDLDSIERELDDLEGALES